MDIRVNDRLEMKKPHPCGKNSKLFDVLRVGMDFRIRCCTCGHEIQLTAPMYTEYYNNNVCPICKGRLKSW